jgi:hypothetical protein
MRCIGHPLGRDVNCDRVVGGHVVGEGARIRVVYGRERHHRRGVDVHDHHGGNRRG